MLHQTYINEIENEMRRELQAENLSANLHLLGYVCSGELGVSLKGDIDLVSFDGLLLAEAAVRALLTLVCGGMCLTAGGSLRERGRALPAWLYAITSVANRPETRRFARKLN